ncbi:unnamed protein product, partial [Mesorhabditis spiculigera]
MSLRRICTRIWCEIVERIRENVAPSGSFSVVQISECPSVTVSVFSVFAIACVVSTSYLPFKELVGITFSYTPFIVVTAICVVVMYFILPETKNRDIDDMSGEVWTLEQSTTGFQHEELRNETESPVNSITSKELSTDKF